jgi:hypothetical protein
MHFRIGHYCNFIAIQGKQLFLTRKYILLDYLFYPSATGLQDRLHWQQIQPLRRLSLNNILLLRWR